VSRSDRRLQGPRRATRDRTQSSPDHTSNVYNFGNMSSVLNSYQVGPDYFPLTVYRVDYPGSQTTYSPYGGFQAASNFTPRRITGLRNALEYHLNWQCRILSPFISTFGSRQHAENWAQVWSENNGYGLCNIVVITIDEADGVMVFDVADLVNRLGVVTSLHPSQYHSEYLCFRHIPSEAIVRRDPVY
jgi:hypothetical protein